MHITTINLGQIIKLFQRFIVFCKIKAVAEIFKFNHIFIFMLAYKIPCRRTRLAFMPNASKSILHTMQNFNAFSRLIYIKRQIKSLTLYFCRQDTFARARTRPKGCSRKAKRDDKVSCTDLNQNSNRNSNKSPCIQDTLSSRAALGLPARWPSQRAECVAQAKVSYIQQKS